MQKSIEEMNQEFDQQLHEGHKIGRLREVFNLLTAGMENWKDPINGKVLVSAATFEEITAAVIFFTGSIPRVKPVQHGNKVAYHVKAAGYYATIGA